MPIRGIEGLSVSQVNFEIQRGGQFVFFRYVVSVILVTFRRSSDVYFVRSGESTVSKSIGFTLLSLLAGWWGIPWGPIYTVQALVTNCKGGKDVTQEVIAAMNRPAGTSEQQQPAVATPIV